MACIILKIALHYGESFIGVFAVFQKICFWQIVSHIHIVWFLWEYYEYCYIKLARMPNFVATCQFNLIQSQNRIEIET